MCRPSGASACSQMPTGNPQQLPSFFHSRCLVPPPSVTTVGSIEPPSSRWQSSGPPMASR